MSVSKAAPPVAPTGELEHTFTIRDWQNSTARITTHWGRSGGVIAVHGEIDAANADQFGDELQRRVADCEWLVLDLSGLQFIGTAGFSALQRVNVGCAQAGGRWALVPGPATRRLLRVCDPHAILPTADTVSQALAIAQDPRRLLHLIS